MGEEIIIYPRELLKLIRGETAHATVNVIAEEYDDYRGTRIRVIDE